jgi:hypothetical protein
MDSPVRIRLSIEPDLCGPVSVGTVAVIRALCDKLGVSLAEANALVDACVFEGREVEIHASSDEAGRALIEALARTQAGPRIRAVVGESSSQG